MAQDKHQSARVPPVPAPPATDDEDMRQVDQFLTGVACADLGQGAAADHAPPPGAEPDPAVVAVQTAWIAAGLGCPSDDLRRVVAGAEAGADRGQVFYGLPFDTGELLVRADGLRACTRGLSPERAGDPVTRRALTERHLSLRPTVAWPDGSRADAWVTVAEGRPAESGPATEAVFYCPSRPGEHLTYQTLTLLSAELHHLYQAGGLDAHTSTWPRAIGVVSGEVLARLGRHPTGGAGADVFGRELPASWQSPAGRLEAGSQVSVSPDGEYRAEACGYVCLVAGRLSVLSPVWVTEDDLHAYWVLLDERAQPLTAAMVEQCLADAGIRSGVLAGRVTDLVALVQRDGHPTGLFPVAEALLPVDGEDARIELLVDLERRAGREAPDGSIDFHEVNYTASVSLGQIIARRHRSRPGVPGHDVKGRLLAARPGEERQLEAGGHVRMGLDDGVEVFAATTDGGVRQVGTELRVVQQLTIQGDIDFSTGNLDFKGDLHIGGSVVEGFSVKATGDISIGNTVENGSIVTSDADVIVGRGILGRRTVVQARGSVRAQFIQEARIEAGGDIVVGNYVYHGMLRADGSITVHQGTGSRGGTILGGRVWAQHLVEAHQVGSDNGLAGVIVAGLQPGQAQQLDRLRDTAATCQEHLQKVLRKFGLTSIDVAQIHRAVAAAGATERQALVHSAHQLGQLVQLLQQLRADEAVLQGAIRTAAKGAAIRIHGTAYWGVTIRVGEQQRRLHEDLHGPFFHLVDDRLAES